MITVALNVMSAVLFVMAIIVDRRCDRREQQLDARTGRLNERERLLDDIDSRSAELRSIADRAFGPETGGAE